jgi:hypothetical protein
MFKKIVPITKEAHGNKKIKKIDTMKFTENIHISSIMMHEFARASAIYPIVFLEDNNIQEFKPVVLLGLEANENLFITEEGKWDASYLPAIIRRYPFALARTDEDNRFTVCIDEESEAVNEEEGNALFNDEGEPTEFMEQVKQFLGELHTMEQITKNLCDFLKEKYMLTPLSMNVREENTVKRVAGAYVVNAERLNNFSDEDFLSLRHQNFLTPIYYHLASLGQIERLGQFKDKKSKSVTHIE